jgi:hypothetical protein
VAVDLADLCGDRLRHEIQPGYYCDSTARGPDALASLRLAVTDRKIVSWSRARCQQYAWQVRGRFARSKASWWSMDEKVWSQLHA